MVLSWKRVDCTPQVGSEVLPQVEEIKYLGVLFMSERRIDREIDRRAGAASAVMQLLHQSVVVKKELRSRTSPQNQDVDFAVLLDWGFCSPVAPCASSPIRMHADVPSRTRRRLRLTRIPWRQGAASDESQTKAAERRPRPRSGRRAAAAGTCLVGSARRSEVLSLNDDLWCRRDVARCSLMQGSCWLSAKTGSLFVDLRIIMGNINYRPAGGSPLTFFQTPTATPSEADLSAMAFFASSSPSTSSSNRTPKPSADVAARTSLVTATDWTRKLSPPSEWAVISADGAASPNRRGEAAGRDDAGRDGAGARAPRSLTSLPASTWQNWQERDSGLEAGEELTQAILGMMDRYKTSLGLSLGTDASVGPEELLKHLIAERDRLAEEVRNLREMLRTERLEWHRFQCDLQIAVSVADRLRAESEQSLTALEGDYKSVQNQLAQAHNRQQETERELQRLRSEQRDVCLRLSALEVTQQRSRSEADDKTEDDDTETLDSEESQGLDILSIMEEAELMKRQKEEDSDEMTGKGLQLTGKGVAEGYIRSLAALERKKDGRSHSEPRKIVMSAERSWSLSRLPLPTDSCQNNNAINSGTTMPPCKREESTRARRTSHGFKRRDSCSCFHAGKPDENLNSDITKPADGLRSVLRRHGGSKRNSLLRWCQGLTQEYENIDITNFSTSWEDGLAFCAVYHKYLPDCIPYNRLKPADKKGNLNLAFRTGESVGITATLSTEDMLKPDGPEWQKVLRYVESIFHHFEK
nr:cytospin-B-like [Nerophis lumbriciformis]